MFFKKLRSWSRSSSKSAKPGVTRITSNPSSGRNETTHSPVPEVVLSSPSLQQLNERPSTGTDDAREHEEFLEKARRDEEEAEKKKLRDIQKARQVNLSPWASRM